MQIWLISDTHFGHENIYKFVGLDGQRIRAGFDNAAHADELMVTVWNERVKPQDHVYHLGDVAMHRSGLAIVKRLQGHKRLILGNHDIYAIKSYHEVGFQKFFGSRKLDALLLSHYPLYPDSIPQWAAGNVHGHIHERSGPSPRHLNVAVERINYRPIPIEEATQCLRDLQRSSVPSD